jgi:putative ABC transport system substrate-binding protein
MLGIADPVVNGYVSSLAHPGGNVTGTGQEAHLMNPKRFEALVSVVPHMRRVALIQDANHPGVQSNFDEIESAGGARGIDVRNFVFRAPSEVESALPELRSWQADALVVGGTGQSLTSSRIIALAGSSRLPTACGQSILVRSGLLISYGPSYPAMYHRGAGHVDRILRGANPRDLPVELPTEFEFAVNLITARALGITIPESLAAHVTEWVE